MYYNSFFFLTELICHNSPRGEAVIVVLWLTLIVCEPVKTKCHSSIWLTLQFDSWQHVSQVVEALLNICWMKLSPLLITSMSLSFSGVHLELTLVCRPWEQAVYQEISHNSLFQLFCTLFLSIGRLNPRNLQTNLQKRLTRKCRIYLSTILKKKSTIQTALDKVVIGPVL